MYRGESMETSSKMCPFLRRAPASQWAKWAQLKLAYEALRQV